MNDAAEQVILVDREDREIGTAAKLAAHESGALHRAFSVLGFNRHGEMLLPRRALIKYHSPGLLADMFIGRPRPRSGPAGDAPGALQSCAPWLSVLQSRFRAAAMASISARVCWPRPVRGCSRILPGIGCLSSPKRLSPPGLSPP